jgi:hypothetical protein
VEQPDERGPRAEPDPTRKLLKVFGVKVTDYEAKTAELIARYKAASGEERAAVAAEIAELTADLDHWLREINAHVLEKQEEVLGSLKV